MKHLKSSSQDLRNLFEENITIELIAEPLKAVAADADLSEILHWMEDQDFDVLGIESGTVVSGYVERMTLRQAHDRGESGSCGRYQREFNPSELIAVSTPLMKLLPILKQTPRLFVLDCNRVNGILTCGDLQKAPVRMLLFGLVTLLEMNLQRLVRLY